MSIAAIALPLTAALIYVAGTLLIKRAVFAGAGARHVTLSINLAMGLIMQPLWFLVKTTPPLWQPITCGILFCFAQYLTFIALSHGDVSVATPLMGTKILFVSSFSVWLAKTHPSWKWWLAVILSTAAVMLITARWGGRERRQIHAIALFAIASAAVFGLIDVFIQIWCRSETLAAFLALMFTTNAIFSIIWYVLEDPRNLLPPFRSSGALCSSGSLLAIQVLLLAIALGSFNDATTTNILYSSRCLWSVILAWALGRWVGARNAEEGPIVMTLRFIGALLLFGAIFLIV